MIRLRKLHEQQLHLALEGALFGSYIPLGGFPGLVGNDITFANPAFAHTFTAPLTGDPTLLHLSDIASQLSVASAGALKIQQVDQHIVFVETVPTTGVAMDATAEVAKRILGVPPNAAGQRVWPLGSGHNPQLAQAFQSHDGNVGCLIVDTVDLVTAPTGSAVPAVPAEFGVAFVGAGKLWSLKATNVSANDRWFLLFDKAVAPVNGDVPLMTMYVPAHALADVDWLHGLSVANGLAWASSTTPDTLTLSGTADFWPVIQYSN